MQAKGPGTVRALLGLRTRGFLGYVGELWRKHGDVFAMRIGGRAMLFAMHPEAVEQVNVSQRKKYDKVASYDLVRRYLTGEGLLGSTGEVWRRQRRLMAPFFTPRGIGAYADLMVRDALRLQERWEGLARRGVEVEIGEEMTAVTASIILGTMFSAQAPESIRQMRDAVETMISFVNHRASSIPWPLWVPTPTNRKYVAARDRVHGLIRKLITERRAAGEEHWPDDLLSRLMKARDEETGEAMSTSLLRDEAITTFFAGHETTARTMTAAWYALCQNPHVARRLHEELDRVLGGGAPTVEALHELPYTLRVIKEVLRLYPPAPFYARDAVEDDSLGGFDVPKGTCVVLSPYYTHRHPRFWERPETFDPDRWAQGPGEQDRAYHPFAAGQRVCIGNNFSLLESHILLAVLAQRFAPRLRPGYRARWEMRGVLRLADGLPMVIDARQSGQRAAAAARPDAGRAGSHTHESGSAI